MFWFHISLGKFDLKVLAPMIYKYAYDNEVTISCVKRDTNYQNMTLVKGGDREQRISFKDVLNYTSPCTLDKFCKNWGSKLRKSIFPYSFYQSVEELKSATKFPPESAFFDILKQVNSRLFYGLYHFI